MLTGVSATGCARLEYGVPAPEPEPIAEYGVPYATFEAVGRVTDEESKPIQNIQVTVKDRYRPNRDYRRTLPDAYTDENGDYSITAEFDFFPEDSVDIIVTDTADIYESDSVSVKVEYDRSQVSPDDHWNEGDGLVNQDFQLKKKH